MGKRMKLISEEEYKRLLKNHDTKTLPNTGEKLAFFHQQEEAENILEDDIPDDIKIHLYSSYKNSMNKKLDSLLKKPKSKPELPSTTSKSDDNKHDAKESDENFLHNLTDNDKLLLKGLPDSIRWKGSFLLSLLKTYPQHIQWNKSGHCEFFYEPSDPNTNIIDLVRFVISGLRWTRSLPPGINRFLFLLKLVNVPTSILSPQLRNEFTSNPTVKPRGSRQSTYLIRNWEAYAKKEQAQICPVT